MFYVKKFLTPKKKKKKKKIKLNYEVIKQLYNLENVI